jgi:hypothetical protein
MISYMNQVQLVSCVMTICYTEWCLVKQYSRCYDSELPLKAGAIFGTINFQSYPVVIAPIIVNVDNTSFLSHLSRAACRAI